MNFLPLTESNPTNSLGYVKDSHQIYAEKCDQVNNNDGDNDDDNNHNTSDTSNKRGDWDYLKVI